MKNIINKSKKKSIVKYILICCGVIIYSIGVKWFVYNANVLPSGLTGLSRLIQKLLEDYLKISLPLTLINVTVNLLPASFALRIIGKKFTIMSFAIMFSCTVLVDILPQIQLTDDNLVMSIFGGILCGFASGLFFKNGVSGGGSDFIALSVSEKYHISAFNYILMFNISLVTIQAFIYGFQYAFYSIIFQYFQTSAINMTYRHYDKKTILIITNEPTLVSEALINSIGHSSTKFDGEGMYTKSKKYLLYMIVTEPELKVAIRKIKEIDPNAFINIIDSTQIQGNFKYLSVMKPENLD